MGTSSDERGLEGLGRQRKWKWLVMRQIILTRIVRRFPYSDEGGDSSQFPQNIKIIRCWRAGYTANTMR